MRKSDNVALRLIEILFAFSSERPDLRSGFLLFSQFWGRRYIWLPQPYAHSAAGSKPRNMKVLNRALLYVMAYDNKKIK